MSMDRFKPPTRSDDLITCEGCGRIVHYEDCESESNFCAECVAEWPDEDVKNCKEKE